MKVLKIVVILLVALLLITGIIILYKNLEYIKFRALGSKAIEANLNENFILFEGQEAQIKGENLKIKAIEVIYSPCPRNTMCIWSGLGGKIEIRNDGNTKTVSLNEIGSEEFGYKVTGTAVSTSKLTIKVSKVSQNDSGP